MDSSGHHRCRQMMRTGNNIGNDLGFRGIRNRRFQHTDDRCHARARGITRIELHGLADHGRILFHDRRPETIRQDYRARGLWTVIVRVEQAAEHRVQSHDLEIRSVHHAGADLSRLAESHR